MFTLIKNIRFYTITLLIATLLIACGKDDDVVEKININYPSSINDLTKLLVKKIDFAASTNPDTITHEYNSEKLIISTNSSRNRYLTEYQYGNDNMLSYSKTTSLIGNTVESETNYTYLSADALTIVTKRNDVVLDSTLWQLSEGKGIEAVSYSKKGGSDVVTKNIYTWNGENIEKHEVYEKIDIETSFSNLVSFPDSLDKTVENIVSYYNLELLENSSDYYLLRRTEFESYNEVINILRYLSTVVPVTESQKIYEIQHTNLYDEDRRAYFEDSGYTTFTADNEGYPLRLATGGAGSRKLDFIYE